MKNVSMQENMLIHLSAEKSRIEGEESQCEVVGVDWGSHKCKPGFVYVARIGDWYKIGCTASGLESIRLRLNDAKNMYEMGDPVFLFALYGKCARGLERYIHNNIRGGRILRPESGGRGKELFLLSPDNLEWLRRGLTSFGGDLIERFDTLNLRN